MQFLGIFLAVILYFFVQDVSFAALVDIPFSSTDAGLKEFMGADTHTGARIDGATQINNALLAIVEWFRYLLGAIAVVWIVWQGYRMLSSQGDETQFTSAKTSIVWGVVALLISFLVDPFIRNVIYGGGNMLSPGGAILDPETSTRAGIMEISGFMLWIKTMLGIITVAMIIFTGIQSMLALDDEAQLTKQQQNIKWILIGIIIIIFNDIIVNYGIYGNPHLNADGKVDVLRSSFTVILELTGFMAYLLSFFAAIALGAIVYGGYLVLTASFNEEQAQQGKDILMNTGIGIILAVVSYTLVRTVIFLQV